MPNEEILSALKNAIDHGESLQSAVQIMINSGYNSEEVQEASRFISGGTLSMQEIMPEEQLTMPEQKPSKFKFWAKDRKPGQINSAIQTQQKQQTPQFKQPIQQYTQQMQPRQQPIKQLPQYPQQITQAQIKQSFQHPMQQYPQQIPQPAQQYSQQQIPRQAQRPPALQLTPRPGELSREIQKIKPAKQGYMKEIILLVILLILIGVLAATIFFKDKILAWFS